MDNLVFHKTEPVVIGVLDWEFSTIGDPLADFAYHVMTWRVTPELFRGLAGIDFAASGIPDEAAYVAAYCRRTGRDAIAAWDFYMVYSLFRIAAILQGIAKRAVEGRPPAPRPPKSAASPAPWRSRPGTWRKRLKITPQSRREPGPIAELEPCKMGPGLRRGPDHYAVRVAIRSHNRRASRSGSATTRQSRSNTIVARSSGV